MALGSMLLTLVTGAGRVAFGGARAQARAERALRQALMAAAQGVQIPSIELRLSQPSTGLERGAYAQAYTLDFIDSHPDQTGQAGWWGPRWRLCRVRFADGNVLEADVLPLRGRAVIVDLGTPHR
jgi:hypothetical protein